MAVLYLAYDQVAVVAGCQIAAGDRDGVVAESAGFQDAAAGDRHRAGGDCDGGRRAGAESQRIDRVAPVRDAAAAGIVVDSRRKRPEVTVVKVVEPVISPAVPAVPADSGPSGGRGAAGRREQGQPPRIVFVPLVNVGFGVLV